MTSTSPEEKNDFFMAYRVGVKTPIFNADDPVLWFAQLEGQFALSNITTDSTKFYYVLAQLEPQHSAEVRDLIVSPPATGKYDKLKTELIKRLSASQERKLKQLLMHEELGDRKPTQFLRHLQHLAGPTVPNDFIRSIWSSRLPPNLQTIVAMQTNSSLEEVAELVDRINEIVPVTSQVSTSMPVTGQVAASQSATGTQGGTIEALTHAVAELTRKMESMSTELRRVQRSHMRGHKQGRSRSRSRSRPNDHPYCHYHYRFGERARKCVQPCTYKTTKSVNYQGSQ